MATSGRGTGMVGYNVQTADDTEHHLIVAHEVTNLGHDRTQLANMAEQAEEAIGTEALEAVADRGYFSSNQIKACEDAGVTTYMPRPQTSKNHAKGLFNERDFIYQPDDDEYECPAGQRLVRHMDSIHGGLKIHRYWTSVCGRCPLKPQCTTGKERRITRWQHEPLLERLQTRLDQRPDMMRIRRQTVEHPFGTIKAWMGSQHCKMKRLEHVSTEMRLHMLAYNSKRIISLFGVKGTIEKMQAA